MALGVGSLILYAVQDVFFKGTSLLESSHGHLQAISGAQLLLERVHNDLRRIRRSDPAVNAASGTVLAFPLQLEVHRVDGTTEQVSYATIPGPEPGTQYVQRNQVTLSAVVLKDFRIEALHPPSATGYTIYGFRTSILATDSQARKDFPLVGFTAVEHLTRRGFDPYWIEH